MKRGGNLQRNTPLKPSRPLERKTRLTSTPKPSGCSCGLAGLPMDGGHCTCGSDPASWHRGAARKAGSLKRSGPIVPKPRSSRVGAATGKPKPLNDFSPAVRALVRKRSGGVCEACGLETAVLHHHRRPRRRDGWRPGTNEPSNALHLGVDCNERIEHQDRAGALALGQLLHAEQDPAAEPVLYRGARVLLADDGSVLPVEIGAVA